MPTCVTGLAAPFPAANVDTDVIMPKRFLRTITREGLADGVMADLRFDAAGRANPDFVLNRPSFAGASVLVVGDNFGCGSSREHAVWGLKQLGITAIIGTSFAGIFYDNARQNLLTLASVSTGARDALLAHVAERSERVEVDITKGEVRWAEAQSAPMSMDAATRDALIKEQDSLSMTLALDAEITAFEANRSGVAPVIVPK